MLKNEGKSMNVQDKNYLLFVPSRLSDSANVIVYKVEDQKREYVGVQTNEAVTKYLIEYLDEKDMKLDKIIMLCTEEVRKEKLSVINGLTTLKYYQESICDFLRENEKYNEKYEDIDALFEIIPYLPSNYDVYEIKKPLEEVIKITENKDASFNKHLYVDFTGGPRSAALTLIFTCRRLQLDGIGVEKILYSNITSLGKEKVGKIEECTNVYDVFAIMEAEEALAYNDRGKMLAYLERTKNKELRDVLKKIDDKMKRREFARQTNQLEEIVTESIGIEDEITKMSKENNSVEAQLIVKAIEPQMENSRKLIKDSQHKEFIFLEQELKMKEHDKALTLFRENIIKVLIDFDLLEVKFDKGNNERVANEIMGAYCYYETPKINKPRKNGTKRNTFIDAALDYVNLLNEYPNRDPLDILEEKGKIFYDLHTYMNKVPKWGFSHNAYSRRICNGKLLHCLKAEYGTATASDFIEHCQKMDQIYMGYGFPFACTYGNTWFFEGYEDIYRKNMRQGAKSLKKYFQGNVDQRMQQVLECFPEEKFTYGTLIQALLKEQYKKMLYRLFPFCLNKNSIYSDIMKGKEWEIFIHDFAQSFYIVKQVRNKTVHFGDLSKEDFDKAVCVMEKIVDQINEIQQKRSEQELNIDSISWANTRHKKHGRKFIDVL